VTSSDPPPPSASVMHKSLPQIDFCQASVEPSRETDFLRQLQSAYHELYATGLAIVGNRSDADDIIQETCVVLWEKFDEFEPGTHFKKWASAVVRNVAKRFAQKRRRQNGFGLSDLTLQRIAQGKTGGNELFELQCEILRECLGKLPEADREFLFDCYRHSSTLTTYAREQGRSVETIYTKLKRLRKRLGDCLARGLGRGESS